MVLVISFLFLPGTFIHELSHAITATFLGLRVTKFSIWPKVENGGIKMGYAQFIVLDVFRNSLIGLAPLIYGICILYFLIINFFAVSLLYKIIFVYLIFQVSNSMFLSDSDLKDFKIVAGIFLLLFGIALVTNFYYQVNFFQNLNLVSNISKWSNFIFGLNISFFLTIIANSIILFCISLIKKLHRY